MGRWKWFTWGRKASVRTEFQYRRERRGVAYRIPRTYVRLLLRAHRVTLPPGDHTYRAGIPVVTARPCTIIEIEFARAKPILMDGGNKRGRSVCVRACAVRHVPGNTCALYLSHETKQWAYKGGEGEGELG